MSGGVCDFHEAEMCATILVVIHEDDQREVVMFKVFHVDSERIVPVDVASYMLGPIQGAAV